MQRRLFKNFIIQAAISYAYICVRNLCEILTFLFMTKIKVLLHVLNIPQDIDQIVALSTGFIWFGSYNCISTDPKVFTPNLVDIVIYTFTFLQLREIWKYYYFLHCNLYIHVCKVLLTLTLKHSHWNMLDAILNFLFSTKFTLLKQEISK